MEQQATGTAFPPIRPRSGSMPDSGGPLSIVMERGVTKRQISTLLAHCEESGNQTSDVLFIGFAIPDSDDADSSLRHPIVAIPILLVLDRIKVHVPVEFQDKRKFRAIEVGDERPHRMLPSKLQPQHSPIPHHFPDHFFSRRRSPPQSSGKFSFRLPHPSRLPPPSNPSPLSIDRTSRWRGERGEVPP